MTRSTVATSQASLVVPPADIAAHWGIELAEPLEPIPARTNVVVRAGAYVIRSERHTPESVRWEHELLEFLACEVPEVVAPIRAADGNTFLVQKGYVVSVFPYIEGEHVKRLDGGVRTRLPDVLARVHRRALAWPQKEQRPAQPSFRELDWDTNFWWDVSLVELSPLLEEAVERSREWVSNAPVLTECAIHGDVHPGNVLAAGGRITGLLDWSFARLDWAAIDLAYAVGVLTLQGDGSIDPAAVDEVITTYANAGGPGEPDVLVPLLRIFFVDFALFSLTRRARGENSNPEIGPMMERGLAKLG
jgi:Ser/Thr protein kinase RdoA (MazF antagonist)